VHGRDAVLREHTGRLRSMERPCLESRTPQRGHANAIARVLATLFVFCPSMSGCSSDDPETKSQTQPSECGTLDDAACKAATGCLLFAAPTGYGCIARPACENLPEASCEATTGCGPVNAASASDPEGPVEYIGCATRDGVPAGGTACTAKGPSEPCWYVFQHAAPDGWSFWPCSSPTSQDACMEGAPF
jgi:hypothetical protein